MRFSLSHMNRLNKTVSAIFIFLFWVGCSRGIDFLPDLLKLLAFICVDNIFGKKKVKLYNRYMNTWNIHFQGNAF